MVDNIDLKNADIVARLREEKEKLEKELMKYANQMPDLKRREISLKIITYTKILYGDKPNDTGNN